MKTMRQLLLNEDQEQVLAHVLVYFNKLNESALVDQSILKSITESVCEPAPGDYLFFEEAQ